ncbi:MAG: hypothetical protein H6708_09820 [Kofleriaceae bacterium]|nr:hypothetical protein [Kofleriaceae bacterium]
MPLGDDATITARFSGVWHLPADVDAGGLTAEAHLLEWPLVGGVRYHVSDPGAVRGYFFGEVGVVLRRTDLVVAGLHDSDFDIAFAAALGAGVELGRVDVHVSAWLADLDRLDDSIGVTVAVGLHALAL